MAIKNKKHSAKKALLKKIIGGKVAKDGASPIKMDGGLGSSPLNPGSGGGANLGKNGIF